MDYRCEITVEDNYGIILNNIYKCGKPAKYISPGSKLCKPYYVCGIHRRSIDIMYKNLKSKLRCKKITKTLDK